MLHKISNWDDAYDNGNNIPSGAKWPGVWADAAADFRGKAESRYRITLDLPYGRDPRQLYDLVEPLNQPKGLVMLIHGGFWFKLDKSYFTHLAKGCADNGWAVVIPSYRLCPDVRICEIVKDVTAAINHAANKAPFGAIRLIGHSAGGHLATMMATEQSQLDCAVQARIDHIVSVSGLHDLRPLMTLQMNEVLKIDCNEARELSPALLQPRSQSRLTCWVGGSERSEFLRQNDLLANIWQGLGAATVSIHQPDRHHFNILDDLEFENGALTQALLG